MTEQNDTQQVTRSPEDLQREQQHGSTMKDGSHLMTSLEKLQSNIPDSMSKTSEPTQVDLTLQTRNVKFNCETHGQVECSQFIFSGNWIPVARCSICSEKAIKEAEDKHMAEQAEREERIYTTRMDRAEIPQRYRDKTFDNYIATNQKAQAAKQIAQDYCHDFKSIKAAGICMIFCGTMGSGKTHLACAMAKTLLKGERPYYPLYTTASHIFRMIKDTFGTKKTEQEIIDSMRRVDLLIIDEVGVQYGTDAERNMLFEVINARYEDIKPTMLISNLALKPLTDVVGDRIMDRLKENGGKMIIFDWESHRGKK